MANTFLTLYVELGDRLNLDSTVTVNKTRLQRWINLIQQDISARYPFSWLKARETVQTVTQETAGTVSVNAGGTTVTGVGTAFVAADAYNSFIQFGSSGTDWYNISAYSSSTSITIDTPYGGATNLSGSAYTVRRVFYDLTAPVQKVIDIRQADTPIKLTNLGESTMDLYQPDIQFTDKPTAYMLWGLDPSLAVSAQKQKQLSFFPIPDNVYNMEVRYIRILTDLSADTDVCQIPNQWQNVLLQGAEWLGCKYLNQSDEMIQKEVYESEINHMISVEAAFGDMFPILQTSDATKATRFVPFPTTFEQPD